MRISDWSSDVCSSDLPGKGRTRADNSKAAAGFSQKGRFSRRAVALQHVVSLRETTETRDLVAMADCEVQHVLHAQRAVKLHRKLLIGQILAVHQRRSEEHTSELQSLMRTSYAVSCLKKKKIK